MLEEKDLETSLEFLNERLMEGYLYYHGSYDDFENKKDLDGFDLQKYKSEYEDALNEWFRHVAAHLQTNYATHLYFHFVKPRSNGMSELHQLGDLHISHERHLRALEEVILWLEEKQSLQIRRDIAEKEYKADILYKITYNDHTREIKLNNIVLAKPDFESENDRFFGYISSQANRPIGSEELSKGMSEKPTKRIAHIIRDLGFTGDLKNIFFPVATEKTVHFVNPISKKYYYDHNLPPINFKKIGRQSKAE